MCVCEKIERYYNYIDITIGINRDNYEPAGLSQPVFIFVCLLYISFPFAAVIDVWGISGGLSSGHPPFIKSTSPCPPPQTRMKEASTFSTKTC